MNDDIRRQALATTAKIALSMTVFGCTTTVVSEQPNDVTDTDDAPTEQPAPPVEEDAPADVYVFVPEVEPEEEEELPEALACEAPPVGEEVAILDEGQLDCCLAELEPVWTEPTTEGWEEWQVTMTDPDVAGCCNVLVAHVDAAQPIDEAVDWHDFTLCCQATNFAAAACTPWGPPVPPALRDGRLRSLDELAGVA